MRCYVMRNANLKMKIPNSKNKTANIPFLRKVFGEKGLADLIHKAEEIKQAKMREKRKNYER